MAYSFFDEYCGYQEGASDIEFVESGATDMAIAPQKLTRGKWQLTHLALARLILVAHFIFSGIMICAPFVVGIGIARYWEWVNNPYLRHGHFFFLALIFKEIIWDHPCPMTVWENYFCERAGIEGYSDTCFAYWLDRLFDFSLKPWMFNLCFGGIGLASLIEYFLFLQQKLFH